MKKLDRRSLLKHTLVLVGIGSVIAREKSEGVEAGTRAVQYGKARYDYPKGRCQIYTGPGPMYCYGIEHYFGWHACVSVELLEPIKKGQALIWHPNGTITGGSRKC